MSTAPQTDILTASDIAAYFHIDNPRAAVRFIYRNQAALGAFKVHRRWLVPRAGLAAFIASAALPASPAADRARRPTQRRARAA